jgi:macrolide-specific efflux system membrane fusion protein
MNKKKIVINTGLSVVLLAAGVEGVRAIGNPDQPKPVEQTATATMGDVASTVTATGNLNAPRTIGLPFQGNPGNVTAVNVKIGQDVEPGQELAKVDDRAAKSALALANVGVQAGEAQLLTAENAPTISQRHLDNASVAAAIREFKNALLTQHQAKIKLDLDSRTQNRQVGAARRQLFAARDDLTFSRSNTTTRTTAESHVPPAPPIPPTVTNSNQRQANATASSSRSSIAGAHAGVVNAETAASTTVLADVQAMQSAIASAKLAKHNLDIAVATGQVNERGAHIGPIAQAKAAIAQANVQVQQAKDALDDTVLKSPIKGTVVYVAGDVGETPASAPRGSAATSATPNGPGSVENRNAATQSGFVILADTTHKSITAQIDEADVSKVKFGQSAVVTFPASGTVVKGTVSTIDVQETVINNVVEYNVGIALDAGAAAQKLGQSASVVITTASKQNVLEVPNNAIITAGGSSIVQVRRGKDLVKVPVTPGLVGDTSTEVTSPMLKPGDIVVLPSATGGGGKFRIPGSGRSGTKGTL